MPVIFTKDEDLGMKAMIQGFSDLQEIVLDIGFFPDSGGHSFFTYSGTKEPIRYSDLARWNEEGQPEKKVPARPFMRSVLDANSTKYWTELAERVIDNLEAGRQEFKSLQALKRVGKVIGGDFKQSIRLWSDPPNSDKPGSTIDKKGFNNPLVHFGELQDAIEYKIRRTRDPSKVGGEQVLFRGRIK